MLLGTHQPISSCMSSFSHLSLWLICLTLCAPLQTSWSDSRWSLIVDISEIRLMLFYLTLSSITGCFQFRSFFVKEGLLYSINAWNIGDTLALGHSDIIVLSCCDYLCVISWILRISYQEHAHIFVHLYFLLHSFFEWSLSLPMISCCLWNKFVDLNKMPMILFIHLWFPITWKELRVIRRIHCAARWSS